MVLRFDDCELDLETVELRKAGAIVPVEPQVFDVLAYLVRHRDRVVPKQELLDHVWGSRFVSESALTSRIKSARRAVGDTGDEQRIIKTVHGRGYRFLADVSMEEARPRPVDLGAGADPTISFVEVRGGVSLALGATGSGPTLVRAATWMTQVDTDTVTHPIWGHWVRGLSQRHRYVRYDPRGSGLSDRDLRGMSLNDLDLWVDDLEAIIDATLAANGVEQVALLGISQGGPVVVGYAVRHPERVSHVVLFGTYARGMKRRDDAHQAQQAALQVDLARVGWGPESSLFRAVFAQQFVPRARSEEIEWYTDQLLSTTNVINAPLLEGAFHDVDVSDLARQVHVPTLVMHALGDRAVPFEEGRTLARLIPGARFVPLDSENHILLAHEPAFAQFIALIDEFTAS